jgi:hypothetical protein
VWLICEEPVGSFVVLQQWYQSWLCNGVREVAGEDGCGWFSVLVVVDRGWMQGWLALWGKWGGGLWS